MNNRQRRVTRLKEQELNATKAKLAGEYGVSTEQVIELVNACFKTVVEMIGTIFQNIGEAFWNIGASLSSAYKEKEKNKCEYNIQYAKIRSYNIL